MKLALAFAVTTLVFGAFGVVVAQELGWWTPVFFAGIALTTWALKEVTEWAASR